MSTFEKPACIFMQTMRSLAVSCLMAGIFAQSAAAAPQDQAAAKPEADVLVFTNGDQLSGTLERGVGDNIVFKSEMAGEITVPMSKVKELRSNNNFAVIQKNEKVAKITRTPGTLTYTDGTVTVATQTGAPEQVPVKNLAYIIDKTTYDKEVLNHPSLLHGWDGSISGGATLVRSTQIGTSFTAGVTLQRVIPTVPYLPPHTRSTVNILENYGKLTQPVIPQPPPPAAPIPPSVAKTSIFHADAEHDKYFSQRFYVLGDLSFDHNFSQGLNLQQVYGIGVGWTPFKSDVQQLDLKADVHYEKQNFQPPTASQNLIGSTFGEAYRRNLPAKMIFTESATILPAFNNMDAYSANAAAGLSVPVYKRFSMALNATDSYLNSPGVGYKKNSFQFVTSIVYNLR